MSELQNYCMVNPENVCDNVCVWDGDMSGWTPPPGYTMLVQATTPTKIWELNQAGTAYVLTDSVGQGSIGFTWDGTFLTTNEPQPAPPAAQPATSGTQTL